MIVALFCLFANTTSGQDIVGHWQFQRKVHMRGPLYFNSLPSSMDIKIMTDSFVLKTTETGKEGTTTISVPMNGKAIFSTASGTGRKLARNLEVSGKGKKKTYIIRTVIYNKVDTTKFDVTRLDEIFIDKSTNQLRFYRNSIESSEGKSWQATGFYKRKLNISE